MANELNKQLSPSYTWHGSTEAVAKLKIVRRADLTLLESALNGKDLDMAKYALRLLQMGDASRKRFDEERQRQSNPSKVEFGAVLVWIELCPHGSGKHLLWEEGEGHLISRNRLVGEFDTRQLAEDALAALKVRECGK